MFRLKAKILRLKLIFMFTWRFLIEDLTVGAKPATDRQSRRAVNILSGRVVTRPLCLPPIHGAIHTEHLGGFVDTLTCIPLGDMTTDGGGGGGVQVVDDAARKEERKRRMERAVPTAGNMTLRELMHLARGLHRSIAAR